MALTNQSPASIRFASVFAGSAKGDSGRAIAVNASGEAYVTGVTSGLLFPVELGAYQPYPSSGGLQAFVCKLDHNGHFMYSTLLGGDGDTDGAGIALNTVGEVYVAGSTSSTNFPGNGPMTLSSGPGTPSAGVFAKFSPDLSALIYSRQTGDWASSIATLERVPSYSGTGLCGGNAIFQRGRPCLYRSLHRRSAIQPCAQLLDFGIAPKQRATRKLSAHRPHR